MAPPSTPASRWRQDLIAAIGGKPTTATLAFMSAWQRKEGGHTHNQATWNWLNRTDDKYPKMPGGFVAAYPNYQVGIGRTAQLINTKYTGIADAIRKGQVNLSDPRVRADLNMWVSGNANPEVSPYVSSIAGLVGQSVGEGTAAPNGGSGTSSPARSTSNKTPENVMALLSTLAERRAARMKGQRPGGINNLINSVLALRGQGQQDGGVTPPTAAGMIPSGGKYPVSFLQNYSPLGAPHQGTHTLGNWQSDNAWDYGAKAGTPIYSPFAATVGQIKPGEMSGRFGGYSLYLQGSPYGQAFLKHLAPNIAVKPGQQIAPGTLLGYIGNVKGLAPHLHAGFERIPGSGKR